MTFYAIKELEMADMNLILVRGNHIDCKVHGAMNTVGRYEEDGCVHFIWRCVTFYCAHPDDYDLPMERTRINYNPCRAGCITMKEREE